jgi:hypothetical protein
VTEFSEIERMAELLYESHRTRFNQWPEWKKLSGVRREAWLRFGLAALDAIEAMQERGKPE